MEEIDSDNESATASECSEMENIDEELDESVAESCDDSEDCAPGSDTTEDVNENQEIGEVPAVETVIEPDSPSDQSEAESTSSQLLLTNLQSKVSHLLWFMITTTNKKQLC